ncbi:ATP-binding protein [Variovorax sp. KK3]|uniref:sensor histidine kinase n=1 Tax=Variovorax sp. KK3 TaxID=1855728 RepID=UPI003AAA3FCF
MIAALRLLWRSVGFRLAFNYGLLVAITMLVALAVIYMQTVGVMHQRTARQVTVLAQQLATRFEVGGADAVAVDVMRALADEHDAANEIYLLVDRMGRIVAGNLDAVPEMAPGTGTQQRVLRAGRPVSAYLVSHVLSDGGFIVVGHDLRDQETIESLVASASAAAGMVAVLLLIGGIFVFRQELERSVGAVRRTVQRIAAGEMQERVALTAEADEFAHLHHEVNAMLDRIQLLMDGVRHVSDTIAHNLRTPLTRILLGLRDAQRAGAPAQAKEEAIGAAIRELEGLTVVFEKLLQIAEAEAGARRRQFEAVALDEVAGDMVELYEPVAEAHGATLRHDPPDPAHVPGDRDLLAGVIANLIENALKYAGAGAEVRVGTRRVGSHVLLCVQDDGPGIPFDEHQRIGTRFHRLDRSQPGHGLGLASVRAVAALHGGRVRFEDAAPGLRVELELPVFD